MRANGQRRIGALALFAASATLCAFQSFAADEPKLNVSISFRDDIGALRIINNDSFSWTSCTLTLNPHGLGGGYFLSRPTIEAGETHFLMSQFADDDGNRFDNRTKKLVSFYMKCLTPTGTRSYLGGSD